MADNTIIFSMQGVGKTIPPSKQILKDIYLSFFYGAKIGIIGANGSGKSTLLHLLDGLLFPDRGDISYRGVALTEALFRKHYVHTGQRCWLLNVEGEISPEHDAMDALMAGFPAGTVSGAPKRELSGVPTAG